MNSSKLVSIIIPSYNRKEYLGKAIESILSQSYKDKEIIIVDDASNDGTEEYIKDKYGKNTIIKYYRNDVNMGAGESRRKGLSNANGEYLIFMDDDDYYTNDSFFKSAIKILVSNDKISFVSSSSMIEYISENRREESIMNIEGEIDNAEYLSAFQQKYMKSNSTFTTIFRKISLQKANINEVEMLNDSTIYLRALLTGNAYILKTISGVYRIHSNNISTKLDVDFIIQNLNEKYKVYEEIKKKNILKNAEEWLKSQILLTISFWVRLNKTEVEEINKLIEWCNNNLGYIKNDIIKFIKENDK